MVGIVISIGMRTLTLNPIIIIIKPIIIIIKPTKFTHVQCTVNINYKNNVTYSDHVLLYKIIISYYYYYYELIIVSYNYHYYQILLV